MSHPEKDELIFIKSPKFFAGVMGSPAGELKQIINTPAVSAVDLDYYDIEDWDYVYVDENFSLGEYLYAKKHYGEVIKGIPSWFAR